MMTPGGCDGQNGDRSITKAESCCWHPSLGDCFPHDVAVAILSDTRLKRFYSSAAGSGLSVELNIAKSTGKGS